MRSARTSYVDVRDIAVVIAEALRSPEHAGKTYELNGPEALTCAQVAEKISQHSRVTARYIDIPAEAQREAMLNQGMPDWQVQALLELQGYYTGGQGGEVDGVLEGLLGRPPVTMDRFLEEFWRESFAARQRWPEQDQWKKRGNSSASPFKIDSDVIPERLQDRIYPDCPCHRACAHGRRHRYGIPAHDPQSGRMRPHHDGVHQFAWSRRVRRSQASPPVPFAIWLSNPKSIPFRRNCSDPILR